MELEKAIEVMNICPKWTPGKKLMVKALCSNVV
jgi:hypothetical protein